MSALFPSSTYALHSSPPSASASGSGSGSGHLQSPIHYAGPSSPNTAGPSRRHVSLGLEGNQSALSVSQSAPTTAVGRPYNYNHGYTQGNGSEQDRNQDEPRGPALLVPTDRTVEELVDRWLDKLAGRLVLDKEVKVEGFGLYSMRTWYLSREHWSKSLVTQTHKQTDTLSAYRLIPDPKLGLSQQEGEAEIGKVTQQLLTQVRGQVRPTKWGSIIVSTPSAFGQDVFIVPGGDLRDAKPFLQINTGLRRLGCGGRAAMTLETPNPALRRKFLELYRLPAPPAPSQANGTDQPPDTSPSRFTSSPGSVASPSNANGNGNGNGSPQLALADPFSILVIELVKLIQASLALWGHFPYHRGVEIDGLFCDETKKGISEWRLGMGMEHEEGLRLEKETAGGCIDPKTLAVLLSSITSTYYQLSSMGVERLPKDPFIKIDRFMDSWRLYQESFGHASHGTDYLTIPLLRTLSADFAASRARSPTDALKVHRLFLSGVAQATSAVSAIKSGSNDDGPLRKREYFNSTLAEELATSATGVSLIIPDDEVGNVASPNIITSNLDAMVQLLKSKEKEVEQLGAKHLSWLWSGKVGGQDLLVKRLTKNYGAKKTRQPTLLVPDGDESAGGGNRGALGAVRRTGTALKDGVGRLARRGTAYETSDSETGAGGLGKIGFARRKQSVPVPLVVEPDVEEVEEILNRQRDGRSLSPSPSATLQHLDRPMASRNPSFLTATSYGPSKRPSIVTQLSNPSQRSLGWDSDLDPASTIGRGSRRQTRVIDPRDMYGDLPSADLHTGETSPGGTRNHPSLRPVSPGAVRMLRTASDGADVELHSAGIEWNIVSPHGTRKGQPDDEVVHANARAMARRRRHTWQDWSAYDEMDVDALEHLRIDVELSHTVRILRIRERELAQRSRDLTILEKSIFEASATVIAAVKARRSDLNEIKKSVETLMLDLERAPHEMTKSGAISSYESQIRYKTTGDLTNGRLVENMRELKAEWQAMSRERGKVRGV